MRRSLPCIALLTLAGLAPALEASPELAAYQGALQAYRDASLATLDYIDATLTADEAARLLTSEVIQRGRERVRAFRALINSGERVNFSSSGEGAPHAKSRAAWLRLAKLLRDEQDFRERQNQPLIDHGIKSALAAWRQAGSPRDLEPALLLARAIQEQSRSPRLPGENKTMDLVVTFLTHSQSYLEAFAADDLARLPVSGQALYDIVRTLQIPQLTISEIQLWQRRFVQKSQAELKTLTAELPALIARRSPAAELRKQANRFELLQARIKALSAERSLPMYPGSEASAAAFLRAYADLLEAMERKDWTLATALLQKSKSFAVDAGPEASRIIEQHRHAIQQEIETATATAQAAGLADLRERLKKISDAGSALKLADDLKFERRNKDRPGGDFDGLDDDLRHLAALWDGDLSRQPRMTAGGRPWGRELAALQGRALREQLSRRLQLPELLQSPLADLCVETAIQQVGAELFKKSEFNRLYTILSESSRVFADRRNGFPDENLNGLKSFLTAQNFERAEQFPEAVMAYKTTLGCIGEFVPVEAAAERLRTLQKEQPNAFPQRFDR